MNSPIPYLCTDRRGGRSLRPVLLAVMVASGSLCHAQTSAGNTAPSVTASMVSQRTRVYENEVFDLTLRIEVSGSQIGGIDYTPGPETAALEFGEYRELADQKSMRNGVVKIVRRFRCSVRATRQGPVRIAPTLVVRLQSRQRMLIGSVLKETPQRVNVAPLSLTILPLPTADRPENWSGAIGMFRFEADAIPKAVSVGDIVTLRMAVSGKGYRTAMTQPGVSPGRHFKAYDTTRVSETGDRVVFEQIVIPQSTNAVSIPPVTFTFFDPLAGKYESRRRGPFPLVFHEKTVQETDVFRPEEDAGAPARGALLGQGKETARRTTIILGVGLSLVLAGVGALRLAQRRRWPAATAFASSMLLMVGSVWVSHASVFQIETARTVQEVEARLAPADSAMPLFAIGNRTEVRVLETFRAWTRVRRGGDSGWVPSEVLEDGEKEL